MWERAIQPKRVKDIRIHMKTGRIYVPLVKKIQGQIHQHNHKHAERLIVVVSSDRFQLLPHRMDMGFTWTCNLDHVMILDDSHYLS